MLCQPLNAIVTYLKSFQVYIIGEQSYFEKLLLKMHLFSSKQPFPELFLPAFLQMLQFFFIRIRLGGESWFYVSIPVNRSWSFRFNFHISVCFKTQLQILCALFQVGIFYFTTSVTPSSGHYWYSILPFPPPKTFCLPFTIYETFFLICGTFPNLYIVLPL